ncbi:hypothetical protein C1645_821317 [Glomus cerebriforme]|uniref:F-box domain-containing protein n=1 Tax=Glomus cerebriforme TaxID=658196 RepID=A0A397T0G2_9GLOM|nr:hypothetical protein C1645_821317 [Glomus cerebriforme]
MKLLTILDTLVACLPNESKELLFRNEIFIPTSTSKPLLFNYPAFCKLSQICHNLQSLTIEIEIKDSNELKELISLQNNLKELKLSALDVINYTNIIPALTKHSNTLTKLQLYDGHNNFSVLFVTLFLNLQEINFLFLGETSFEGVAVHPKLIL